MAAPTSFGRDRGLQARMLFTMLLLGAVYVVFIALLIALGAGVIAVAVLATLGFLAQYFGSARIALAAMGAHRVSGRQAPELHAIIERLCIQANLPMPRLAVAETAMPNAFAVGRSPSTTTVCATTGLFSLLEETELEAVLAHELSHVANRDTMVMTIASLFASIAAFIARWGEFRGSGSDDRDDDRPSWFPVVILSGLVFVVSYVLIQALSRDREFAADRGSAIMTGRPSALSSALEKISGQLEQMPQRELRGAAGELAAFYIIPPDIEATVATLFSTHPPLARRLQALAPCESQLQGT
jgi:heat shock protein HtpX